MHEEGCPYPDGFTPAEDCEACRLIRVTLVRARDAVAGMRERPHHMVELGDTVSRITGLIRNGSA